MEWTIYYTTAQSKNLRLMGGFNSYKEAAIWLADTYTEDASWWKQVLDVTISIR